jgi:2-octaprenyl-6-methoxyphenol hydroxylase
VADPAILIVGAGPVGLTAALALRRAGHAVRVVDAKPVGTIGAIDPRAIALSHGSRLILERLGVWQKIVATPIEHVHVSQQQGFGQTRIEAADYRLPALGHVTRLGLLTHTLLRAATDAGIAVTFGAELRGTAHADDHVAATIRSGGADHQYTTPLLILAEGKPAGSVLRKEYGQTAIVTEAWSTTGHDGRAFERFTPEGPLALLPLDTGHSVVWCMRDDHAQDLLTLDDATFLARLNQATTFARRTWTRVAARATFPLTLLQAPDSGHPREIALGNAAQTLHPVAGQGLNLGLRDAFELAEALQPGLSLDALSQYRKRRALDRAATITLTDQYVSLFSNQLMPLRVARGAGLALFNLVPPLRRVIARRMMFGLR